MLIQKTYQKLIASVPRFVPTIFAELITLKRTPANHLDLEMNPLQKALEVFESNPSTMR